MRAPLKYASAAGPLSEKRQSICITFVKLAQGSDESEVPLAEEYGKWSVK